MASAPGSGGAAPVVGGCWLGGFFAGFFLSWGVGWGAAGGCCGVRMGD